MYYNLKSEIIEINYMKNLHVLQLPLLSLAQRLTRITIYLFN